jgi:hypothetical protein
MNLLFFLSTVFITCCFVLSIHSLPTYNYAYQTINGVKSDVLIESMTQDSSLNDIVCGSIYSNLIVDASITLTFPPSLVDSGERIAVIGKISKTGTWIWFIMINATDGSLCKDITIDNNDNVYITGHFSGTATFPPSTSVSFADAGSFGYVAKIDKNGNTKWVTTTRTLSGYNTGTFFNAIDIDNTKNLYVSGAYNGQITIGSATYTASTPLLRAVVAKLNSAGVVQWSNVDSSTSIPWNYPVSQSTDIVYDTTNSVLYILGSYRTGPVTFDTFTLSVTQQYWERTFVASINPNIGAFTNAVPSYGGTWSYDVSQSFAMTASGNYIFITGLYRGTISLDSLLTPAYTLDSGKSLMPWHGFLAIYTTALSPVAISSIDSDFVWPFSICPVSATRIAVCGSFSGTMTPSALSTSSLAGPFTLIYDISTPSNPTYTSSIVSSPTPYIPYKYRCYCDGNNNVFSAFGFENSGTFGTTTLTTSSKDIAIVSASF